MSLLRDELLRILVAEASYAPLSIEQLARVLQATGFSNSAGPGEIEAALQDLMRAGTVEAIYSARLGKRYRIQATRAAAADETIRA